MITRNQLTPTQKEIVHTNIAKALVADISQLIDHARLKVSREYNNTQVKLCWLIGNRTNTEILEFQKAQYGEQVIDQLAEELTLKYGRDFSRPNLFKMAKFTKLFGDLDIVSTLSRQLS